MIFPDWGDGPATTQTALPLYTEWAMDWETGTFALREGRPYTVTGTEALKSWVRLALHPESVRFLYSAHSADYGNALTELLGEGFSQRGILENRLRRELRECLLMCPYVTAVDGFVFTRQGSGLKVAFTVHTVYEPIDEEVILI